MNCNNCSYSHVIKGSIARYFYCTFSWTLLETPKEDCQFFEQRAETAMKTSDER